MEIKKVIVDERLCSLNLSKNDFIDLFNNSKFVHFSFNGVNMYAALYPFEYEKLLVLPLVKHPEFGVEGLDQRGASYYEL